MSMNVIISCHFEKLSALVQWDALTVEWKMVDKHGQKRIVYTLEDGREHISRTGAVVDRMQLQRSDASLHLLNVTVADEGLYTCRVITPVVYMETTTLEVLGIPLLI